MAMIITIIMITINTIAVIMITIITISIILIIAICSGSVNTHAKKVSLNVHSSQPYDGFQIAVSAGYINQERLSYTKMVLRIFFLEFWLFLFKVLKNKLNNRKSFQIIKIFKIKKNTATLTKNIIFL